MDLWTLSHCFADLNDEVESQGPENIVDQVDPIRQLQINERFVSEHNTANIKAAAMGNAF